MSFNLEVAVCMVQIISHQYLLSNHNNMNILIDQIKQKGNELVDNSILETMCNLLSEIKENDIDFEKSEISIVKEGLHIKLIPIKDCMQFNVLLWNNVVNFYISEFQFHPYDDLFIKSEKDLKALEKNLKTWFHSEIHEKLFKARRDIKYYEYSYTYKNKTHILYTNKPHFMILKRKYEILDRVYRSWFSEFL